MATIVDAAAEAAARGDAQRRREVLDVLAVAPQLP